MSDHNDPTDVHRQAGPSRITGYFVAASVGVAVDAFVVRLTLVPAVMAIVRAKLWYHPQWFAKYVPDPDIEGERLEERPAAERMLTGVTAAPKCD